MLHDSDLRERLLRAPLQGLIEEAKQYRDRHYGCLVSYSRKVFIPLTRLCRNASLHLRDHPA